MAFNYQRKDGDAQYRIASLMNETISPWMDFTGSTVDYPEQCVLEILREDGTTSVEYERPVRAVNVGRDGNQLYLSKEIPVARMWIRSSGNMAYKIPADLKEKDGKVYMLIPGGSQNVTIGGDVYFNKVYSLSIG